MTPGSALLGAAVACALAIGAACSRPSAGSPDGPGIRLTLPPDGAAGAFIEVVGLSSDDLDALSDARLTTEQWTALLRVSVGGDAPPMLGTYSVTRSALRFTPAFPLDPGRQYEARFDLTGFPHSAGNGRRSGALVTTVSRPATTTTPSTVVARVYPSADVLPENQLRFYIQFSGPMGLRAGLDHVHLVDEHGREVEDPFLPLDLELWNADRTRYTVFVDPGRVKTDLLPQQQLGPSLESGRTYTLVIDSEWRDAAGLPLEQPFRRTFRVGPADEEPIQPDAWTIAAPAPGTRDPLVVTFPEPLDHGLLLRSLGVSYASGARLEGQSRVEARETRWVFVPHAPWRAGDYRLVVLSILEDLAGNQIGRPFEVDRFDEVDDAEPKTILRPFRVGSGQQAVGSRQ